MKVKLPIANPLLPLLGALVLALPCRTQAQDPFPSPPPPPDPLAGIPVQVLDQQQVTIGAHTITYNRITPPALPTATPKPTPQATPAARTTGRVPQTQAQRKARAAQSTNAAGAEKPYKVLFLSATVYDHLFTEVHGFGDSGPVVRAYVNIDFAYCTTVTTFETADAVYNLFFAWSNDTVSSLAQAGQTPPNLTAFPPGRTSYQTIGGNANTNPDALAALDGLCIYYDANSAQMIAAYNQREAANAAHRQWLIDHPPVQPDTVINYWPTKGSAYLNQPN